MTTAREATRLLLAAWLGAGMLFAASVAPAAFAVLPSRALAGLVVGRVLPVIFFSGALLAAMDFAVEQTYARRASDARLGRRALDAVAIIACLFAQLSVGGRIHTLRERIGPNLDALAPSDPLRIEFGRLHAISVGLLGVAMLAIAFGIAIDLLLDARSRALAASGMDTR